MAEAVTKTKTIKKYNIGKFNWTLLLVGTIVSWAMIALLIVNFIVKTNSNDPLNIIFWTFFGLSIFFGIFNGIWLIQYSKHAGILMVFGIINIFLPFVAGTYVLTIVTPSKKPV